MDTIWYIANVEGVVVKDEHYLTFVRGEQKSHSPGALFITCTICVWQSEQRLLC